MQNIQAPLIQPVGEVTIHVRDADTLELKRTVKNKNVITTYGYNRILGQGQGGGTVYVWNNNITQQRNDIFISTQKLSAVEPLFYINNYITGPNQYIVEAQWVDGNPSYAETQQRFNAPGAGNARTIYTIFLGNYYIPNNYSYAEYLMLAYTSLDTPCVQGDNEVLDITYRIQFFPQPVSPSAQGVSPQHGYFLPRWYFSGDQRAGTGGGPSVTCAHWNSKLPSAGDMITPVVQPHNLTANRFNVSADQGHIFKRTSSINLSTSVYGGQIFGMLSYGGTDSNSYLWNTNGHRHTAWAPMTPSDFPNKPIQPIHNHNVNAFEPFLDVDYLASSQGTLTVDGSAWTDPDFPKFYRIEYSKSGAVGTANYFFRKRSTLGFVGPTSYRPRRHQSPSWAAYSTITGSASTPDMVGLSSLTGLDLTNSTTYHGLKPTRYVEEYDKSTAITWDDKGIVIYDEVDPTRIKYFNATTTPSLPATAIRQVARDNTGNIYVACRNTGLYRISTPFGTPVVTQFTNTLHGVPDPGGGGAPACYGVAAGYNNRIWALFNGGLSYTDNEGVSWTNLTPSSTPVFSHAKITAGLWSNVQFISADREASTHQVALVTDPDNDTAADWELIWYTPTGGGVATEYVGRVFNNIYKSVGCSFRKSVWTGSVGNNVYRLKFGDATTANELLMGVGSGNQQKLKAMFFYDYYGNPLAIGNGNTPGGFGDFHNALFQPDGEMIANQYETYTYFTSGYESCTHHLVWEREPIGLHWLSNRWISGINNHSTNDVPYETYIGPTARSGECLPAARDITLNHSYSPLEETVWSKYHWNGSAWQKNYFAPAVDTSTYSLNAARHNFNTESHTFTGRSLIDASAAFPTGMFATTATFVFKLIPDAKYGTNTNRLSAKSQEYEQTLFEVADTSTNQSLRIVWRSTTNNITVIDNTSSTTTTTTVGATPANASTHRIVVVVNGTTLTVYLNGVVFGSPVTLNQLMSFANSSSVIKAYIGARAYVWNYQKNSTLPGSFYRGVMENVQFWNVAWNATDVTNDYSNINGVIGSKPASNMIARYQLTQSLEGLETKTTHSTAAALDDGITIAFNNGASGTSFVATDYHTFGVVDGILKDNATSLTQEYSLYMRPSDINFTEFTNPAGGVTVPATTSQVTETACWAQLSDAHSQPGLIAFNGDANVAWNATPGRGGITAQWITGDGWFEAKPGGDIGGIIIGFVSSPTAALQHANVTYGIRLNTNGTVDIIQGNTVTQTNVSSFVRRDTFRIVRSGTTVSFYKVVAGTPVQIGVASGTPSTGTLYGVIVTYGRGCSAFDAKVNWTQPAHTMRIGKSSTLTGAYDPYFFLVDTDVLTSVKININGTPATVLSQSRPSSYWANMPAPGPGEVTVNGRTGHLIFNSADAGATITGEVTVIYTRF